MPGLASEDDEGLSLDGPYDSFLREVAHATDGTARTAIVPLRPGAQLLGGRFEIERALGTGGMGVVYAARDRDLGCAVAVKTLRAPTLDALHRLRDEFLVLYDLAHPNLVSLGELFDDDGRWFFSMELVDGVDFLHCVRPDDALDVGRLRGAMAQLAAGLGFLHARGKVHRDVKPSNVLCTAERVVLLDFGLASAGGDSARAGTLPYMAPEQHAGEQSRAAADWYAVGVMLWAALAGRMPFTGDERELADAKRRGAPPLDGPADLVALARALLEPDAAQRPIDDEILQRLGARPPPRMPAMPFVGRGCELAGLRAAWGEAQAATRTVFVRGPSGVGKSALLARFADELRGAGAIVLPGRCHERVAMPYKAMHGIAAALAAHLRDDPDARRVALGSPDVGMLPEVFPSLSELAELTDAARGAATIRDPQQRRTRVFDAFAELVARLAAHAPLALMIDDLQWADRDGLALLEHIAARTPARALVVAAARDAALDGSLAGAAEWLAAGAAIDVGGLDPADAEELARRLAGDAAAGAIAREATGHPLHISELARTWQLGLRDAAPRLDDAIAGRVRELPPDQARVLSLIAIAGALPQAVIGEAAGLDGAGWWPALAALRASHLVRTHGPRGGDVVEPYHDRVRETVAARLAPEVVVAGHTRLASALASRGLGAERPDLLALHFEGAERPVDAAHWTERAADQAARALAFDRAAELYLRTRALLAHAPDHAASLQSRLGDALANAGRGAPAAEAYLAGAALVTDATGDDEVELRRRAAEQLLRSGHIDEGLRVIDGVFREVGLPPMSRRRWPVGALIVQRGLLRIRRWRGSARRASTDRDRRKLACCWSAVVGMAMTSPLRMAEYQTRHLRLAYAAGDTRRIALGMCFEAPAAALAGPPATRAHALLDEARAWAAQVDDRVVEPYVALAEGTVALLSGRWRDSFARCDAAERGFRDDCVGVAWEIGTSSHIALSCLWYMGRVRELRTRLVRALDEADRRGDLYAATELRTALHPMMLLMDDREPAARDTLARAKTGLPERETTMQHWQHTQSSALVELYAGAPEKALALIERGLPAVRRAFLLRIYAVRSFTAFLRAAASLGTLAAGDGDADRLRTSVERTCAGLGDDVLSRSVTEMARAGLAVLRGDVDAAASAYRAAADGYDAGD
ncbi:MAG TPA: AAA family ATPase, partial [Kofleriaceae bacterium]|nr:AAA family ATPase [Kofleriaceae bacterium]